MGSEMLVSVVEFCQYYHVDTGFVQSLEQNGLIETKMVEQVSYMQSGEVRRLEKFVRLHQDLNLPADSLDIVAHLLNRLEGLQQEIDHLKSQLVFYEKLENDPAQKD